MNLADAQWCEGSPGDWRRALSLYEAAIAAIPALPEKQLMRARIGRARCLALCGERDEFTAALDDVTITDSEKEALRAHLLWQPGMESFRREEHEKGAQCFEELLSRCPQTPAAPVAQYFHARCTEPTDRTAAVQELEGVVRQWSDTRAADRARLRLAELATEDGDHGKAVELYEQAARRLADPCDGPRAREGLGEAYSELGRFEEALAVYKDAAARYPKLPAGLSARIAIGTVLLLAGEADRAITHWQGLLADPQMAAHAVTVHRRIAEAHALAARPKKAIRSFHAALSAATGAGNDGARLSRRFAVQMAAGDVHLQCGDASSAERHYRAAFDEYANKRPLPTREWLPEAARLAGTGEKQKAKVYYEVLLERAWLSANVRALASRRLQTLRVGLSE